MPFKHKSISYGLPQDPFDNEKLKEYYEDLQCALNLKRKPVGVKFYFTEEDYNNCEKDEPSGPLSYCCIVEKATRGKSFKARLQHLNCDGGTTALGLEDSTPRIESGMEYFSYNLYSTPAVARRVREGVMGLYRTGASTYGIEVASLKDFIVAPDIIIFIVNPYEAMRIQQGYVYHTGERITATLAAMQGICAEITVEPYLTGKMNISTLCPSTRFLAKWEDDEMAIGIPYEQFESTVKGIIATINTTDLKYRKEEIVTRFGNKNKDAGFIIIDKY